VDDMVSVAFADPPEAKTTEAGMMVEDSSGDGTDTERLTVPVKPARLATVIGDETE